MQANRDSNRKIQKKQEEIMLYQLFNMIPKISSQNYTK